MIIALTEEQSKLLIETLQGAAYEASKGGDYSKIESLVCCIEYTDSRK